MDGSPSRGRQADTPAEIPKRGWLDILWRVKREVKEDAVAFYAAGVSFYLLLAFVPTLAAVASIYGLAVDRSTVVDHVGLFDGFLPREIVVLLETELQSLASSDSSAGWALAFSLALALWGSSKAIEAITVALNRVYDEKETRNILHRKLNSLVVTACLLLFLALLMLLLVAAPAAIAFAGLSSFSDRMIGIARWPLVFFSALFAITALYRFAPCRRNPKWRWVAPGSLFAAIAWVAISFGLTLYTTQVGWSNKTYGSLAVVVLLMSFFYLSSIAFLIGGEINAETEHQSTADSTVGKPRPMGERGAYVADTVGQPKP